MYDMALIITYFGVSQFHQSWQIIGQIGLNCLYWLGGKDSQILQSSSTGCEVQGLKTNSIMRKNNLHVHFYSSLYTVCSSVISYPYAGNNKNAWCNVSAVEKSVTKVITTYKPCKDKILNDRNIHTYYNLNTHSIRYKYWTYPSQCL